LPSSSAWPGPATDLQLAWSCNWPVDAFTAVAAPALQMFNNVKDPAQELPINQGAFPISTSMFEGVVEVHLRGLATTQRRIFDGKKRCFQVMCQVGQKPRAKNTLKQNCDTENAAQKQPLMIADASSKDCHGKPLFLQSS
jgi:hypothetical protein